MGDSTQYFDNISQVWDKDSLRLEIAKNSSLAIQENIPLNKTMHLLDFGCGTGLVSFDLAPFVQKISGVDNSPKMVEEFNKKAATHKFNASAEFVKNDKIEFKESMYDLAVSSMVFHHLIDPMGMIQKLYHSIKIGGYLCIVDLDPEDGSFHPPDIQGVYHHGFSRNQMKVWFKTAGFEKINTETAFSFDKNNKEYSIFLCTGKRVQ